MSFCMPETIMKELRIPKGACMVFFDDDQGLCCPMGWDTECDGALESCAQDPVVFPSRKAANTAIDISRKHAALRKAQGLYQSTDFLPECRKAIHVRRVVPAKGGVA